MDYASNSFEMEHVLPLAADGDSSLDNLALACGGCNSHKHTKVDTLDPVNQIRTLLFHPRQQAWHEHFEWSAGYLEIVGKTAVGRATVSALRMNRPSVINLRRVMLLANLHPPDDAH